jgi:hypothetical protein
MNSPKQTRLKDRSGAASAISSILARFTGERAPDIRTPRSVAAIGILAAVITGVFAYAALRPARDGLASDPRQVARIQVMQEHLATQTGPFIILAGDSHAERLGWDRVCGKPVVNLGLSGITAIHYGKILSRLVPVSRADAMVVFLGTNDLSHKLRPGTDKSVARFESRFESVIDDSRRFADKIVYAPLFPQDPDPRAATWLDVGRAPQYRLIASKVCRKSDCVALDLDQIALGTAEDGVHADRVDRRIGGSLHVLLEQQLCPNLQGHAAMFSQPLPNRRNDP